MTEERSAQVLDDLPDLGAGSSSEPRPPTSDVAHLVADLAGQVRPMRDARLTAMGWQQVDPVGEAVRLVAVVTRCAVDPLGVLAVSQSFTVEAADGSALCKGSLTWRGSELPTAAADAVRRSDICSTEWGAALRARLEQDPEFADATRAFDGAVELVAEDRAFQLRIYRGAVLEAGRRTPHGPTFSVVGSDLAWTRLLTADRNDFTSRASSGQFGSRGSSFEYLRMFKAVVLVAGQAREQWKEQRDALRALPRH